MYLYSASSLKQQSAGRLVAILGHIILIASQPALSPLIDTIGVFHVLKVSQDKMDKKNKQEPPLLTRYV
jgi:hypothetical protein